MGMIALESTFMFCSSMAVFIYITSGGVVGPDIRKMIRFKDLIFGSFLFFLLSSYYTYKFTVLPEEQRNAYDSHIVHLVGNMLMLESLLHNRSAMAYWRQIVRRWRTNLGPCCRGARVGPLVAPSTLVVTPTPTSTVGALPGSQGWPQGPSQPSRAPQGGNLELRVRGNRAPRPLARASREVGEVEHALGNKVFTVDVGLNLRSTS